MGVVSRRMRPTIPLADWRIASDLAAARAVAAVTLPPPCGRECVECRNWSLAFATAIPESLASELRRLGVDPALPTDVYAFGKAPPTDPAFVPHRVTYYTVGEILSGPALWVDDARVGRLRNYTPVSSAHGECTLSVAYARDDISNPEWYRSAQGEAPLIQVDFRLDVPWLLSEPRPAV